MSLIIISKSPKINVFSLETYKIFLRKLIGKDRGPNGVTESVVRGLNELNYEYKLDPKIKEISPLDTIWINESINALKWAIDFKNKNTTKLIVGPNLVVTPLDEKEILCSENIDIILQPSEWTKKFYTSLKPELENKIKIWPAGVEIPELEDMSKKNDVLIYIKNDEEFGLVEKIKTFFNQEKVTFEIMKYGTFKQFCYFDKLEKSKAMLYIAKSESQGLAIQEAWARNVPTLIFDKGYFKLGEHSFVDEKISAPYLNEQSGIFFTANNFEETFHKFWNTLDNFTPRKYVIENLSDKVCAQKFLEIVNANLSDKI